jgi:hypothetical protein
MAYWSGTRGSAKNIDIFFVHVRRWTVIPEKRSRLRHVDWIEPLLDALDIAGLMSNSARDLGSIAANGAEQFKDDVVWLVGHLGSLSHPWSNWPVSGSIPTAKIVGGFDEDVARVGSIEDRRIGLGWRFACKN